MRCATGKIRYLNTSLTNVNVLYQHAWYDFGFDPVPIHLAYTRTHHFTAPTELDTAANLTARVQTNHHRIDVLGKHRYLVQLLHSTR